MTPEKFKRKLSAILSADVKGYSRLMGEDEEGTIRTLNAYLEVITGFIQQHRGRVVGTAATYEVVENIISPLGHLDYFILFLHLSIGRDTSPWDQNQMMIQ